MKQKNLLMKCDPGHTLSVLKPISFVVKWRCVVSVLSPLASKSYGGSQFSHPMYIVSALVFYFTIRPLLSMFTISTMNFIFVIAF